MVTTALRLAEPCSLSCYHVLVPSGMMASVIGMILSLEYHPQVFGIWVVVLLIDLSLNTVKLRSGKSLYTFIEYLKREAYLDFVIVC